MYSVYPKTSSNEHSSRSRNSKQTANSLSSFHDNHEDQTPSADGAQNDNKQYLLNQFKVPGKSDMPVKQQHHQSNASINSCGVKNTGGSIIQDDMDLELTETSIVSGVNNGKRRRVRKRKKKNAQINVNGVENDENKSPPDSNVEMLGNEKKKVKGKDGLDQHSTLFMVPKGHDFADDTVAGSLNKHIR